MRNLTFSVKLSEAATAAAQVDYATVDGTASAENGDYTPVSGTLVFAVGETQKTITVPIRDDVNNAGEEAFYLAFSNPVNCQFGDDTQSTGTIPAGPVVETYASKFQWMYDAITNADNGYFGPATGTKAKTIPYHSREKLIVEAPDYGGESVSETVSFYAALEAANALVNDSGNLSTVWGVIESSYIPSAANQPTSADYDPGAPATYQPEGDEPSDYPTATDGTVSVGVDPLSDELAATYGNNRMYLMHWIIDVDGAYGFHNGDGDTKAVFINNYQRGMHESVWETITFPCWEDFSFGGTYGFLPFFNQGTPLYPDAENDYSEQWRYTCAPDAEARALFWTFFADKEGVGNTSSTNKAKKMGDYLRFCLFDKYFKQIGSNRAQGGTSSDPYTSCHFLISWYVSWGGMVPDDQGNNYWAFRIGSSECHQGYQSPDIAYLMATDGGGYSPDTASAGDIWKGAAYRQLELIRWLQTEDGLIAGGVTNSWKGRYETPDDGRQNAGLFYGMFYTYAPVWHDPPSNNWFGFQCWGLQRVANLHLISGGATDDFGVDMHNNSAIILDRFVNWVLSNVVVDTDAGTVTVPGNLTWTSSSAVPGETTTSANIDGVYEYIPMNSWDGTGDYAAFWSASSVPNPTLKGVVADTGTDLGVIGSLSILLLQYAQAKRNDNKFENVIPNGTKTAQDAYLLAKSMLDCVWDNYRDGIGITSQEIQTSYNRFDDVVYVPSNYSGTMPDGSSVATGATFISMRPFIEDFSGWSSVSAYLAGGSAPAFTYHRFWAQAEFASANALMHHHFGDLLGE